MIAGVAFAVRYATAMLVMPALPGADDGAARVQALLLAFSTLALAAAFFLAVGIALSPPEPSLLEPSLPEPSVPESTVDEPAAD